MIGERIKNAWNAFMNRDPTYRMVDYGYASSYRPDLPRLTRTSIKSMLSSVYGQIAVDCSLIDIRHVRLNDEGNFKETIDSSLNYALTKSANIDQSGRELIRDAVISMLDEGCVAIVPTVTDVDPMKTESYKIEELRVGKVVEWMPRMVTVELYNDLKGQKDRITLDKRIVAIIENPFYVIMNEPNSTAKRLSRLLNQLERSNDEVSSGKLDLIIQYPFALKSDARKAQAEQRRKTIEAQLVDNKLGIAYTDATEKVIQLNRSLENNLWTQAKELQAQLFNELGLTQTIFDGTADEQTLLNYNNRTIEPILSAITEGMERKWISKTAQTQGQAIRFYKSPFKLVPVAQLAEIADKFTRNEIMSSNEFRSVIGLKPSDDPKADQLRNANLNHPDEEGTTSKVIEEVDEISK